MARVDARLIRFHDLRLHYAADIAGIPCPDHGSDCGLYFDAMVAPDRCHRFRLAGRSHRPQEAADDLDRLVLRLQFHRRLLPELRLPVLLPCNPRHWYGRGVAGGSLARHGILADPVARLHGRRHAGIMGPGRPAVGSCIRSAVRLHRLARFVVDRRPSSTRHHLCAAVRERASGLAREPPPATRAEARGASAAAGDLQG